MSMTRSSSGYPEVKRFTPEQFGPRKEGSSDQRPSARLLTVIAATSLLFLGFDQPISSQNLDSYVLTDQWPDTEQRLDGVISDPVSLDVAYDGRVFISDAGSGVVHVLDPRAGFQEPIGGEGTGQERLVEPGRLALDPRMPDAPLYVLDGANDRVVVFDPSGSILGAWGGIAGAGIAVSDLGLVYIADRGRNQVVVYDSTGLELGAIGARGDRDGEFTDLMDVSVSPGASALVVADTGGLRVQVFDLRPEGNSATFRQSFNLSLSRYRQWSRRCLATAVHALDDDRIWLGEGAGICMISPQTIDFVGSTSYLGGNVCLGSLGAARVRPSTGDVIVIGDLSANWQACSRPPTDQWRYTTPVILQFETESLRAVKTSWPATSGVATASMLLSPSRLDLEGDGSVLIKDTSPLIKRFSNSGTLLETRPSFGYPSAGAWERITLGASESIPDVRDVVSFYSIERRWRGPTEHGIGRFQIVERRSGTMGQTIEIAEAVWTRPWIPGARITEPIELAFNPATAEILVLVNVRTPSQRTEEARIERFEIGSGLPLDDWMLPSDSDINGYTDLYVNPEGLVFALDEQADTIVVISSAGMLMSQVPVAHDVRQVAGASASQVFALRESGFIERLDAGGTVTARFDGRPFAGSSPSSLRDIAVDDKGRVFSLDGRSGVVSIFQPADSQRDALVLPSDDSCVFAGNASASPMMLALGGTIDVTRRIQGRCGPSETASDIMVIAPIPGEDWRAPNDRGIEMLTWFKQDLQRLVSRVDFSRHRVGLVTYHVNVDRNQVLTHDRPEFLAEIARIRAIRDRVDRPVFRLDLAVRVARTMLSDPDRRQVIVLYYPLFCNRSIRAAQCSGWRDPAIESDRAINDGIQMIVFRPSADVWAERRDSIYYAYGHPQNGNYSAVEADHLASSDEDVLLQDFSGAFRRMVRHDVPITPARDLIITDSVAGTMILEPGSLEPGATVVGQSVRWALPDLALGRLTLQAALRPQAVGRWPVSDQTTVALVDARGLAHAFDLPIPSVEIIAPTSPPPSPTLAPEATPTVRPTEVIATEAPWRARIHLPIIARNHILLEPS